MAEFPIFPSRRGPVNFPAAPIVSQQQQQGPRPDVVVIKGVSDIISQALRTRSELRNKQAQLDTIEGITGEKLPRLSDPKTGLEAIKLKRAKEEFQKEQALRLQIARIQAAGRRGRAPSVTGLKTGILQRWIADPTSINAQEMALIASDIRDPAFTQARAIHASNPRNFGKDQAIVLKEIQEMARIIRQGSGLGVFNNVKPKITFKDSNGDIHTIFREDLPAARKQDPGLKVVK